MNLNYMNDIFEYHKVVSEPPSEPKPPKELCDVNEDDLYAILGCQPSSTIEQIMTEYRIRARELHPDKCSLTEQQKEEVDRKFCKLQRAKDILCDEARRRDYDRWRQSGLHVSYRKWCQLNESGGLHNSIHWFGARDRQPALMAATGSACDTSSATNNRTDINMNMNCSSDDAQMQAGIESVFRRSDDCKPNSLLRQFRNYEI